MLLAVAMPCAPPPPKRPATPRGGALVAALSGRRRRIGFAGRRADHHEDVLTAALVGAWRKPGQCVCMRRRAGLQNNGWERPAFDRREDADIQGEFFLGAKSQMHEAVLDLAVQHGLGGDLDAFDVSRRGRHFTDGVVLERAFDFLAAFHPLFSSGDFGAVVCDHRIGQVRADGQFVDAGHFSQVGLYFGNGDFLGVWPRGGRGGLREMAVAVAAIAIAAMIRATLRADVSSI